MVNIKPFFQRILTVVVLTTLLGGSALTINHRALAHGGFSGVIPILGAPHVVPSVDGVCNTDEYSGALTRPILFRPNYNYPDATVRILKMNFNLYI